MEESVARVIFIVLCILIIILINKAPLFKEECPANIAIAKKDLSKLGDTSIKLTVSLEIWLYSILVIVYRRKGIDVMPTIRDWAATGIDPAVTIDLEKPYTKFLNAIDTARRKEEEAKKAFGKTEKIEPIFGVSSEYDYHVLPKILKFNDFVDCQSLLIRIDEITGGAVNE